MSRLEAGGRGSPLISGEEPQAEGTRGAWKVPGTADSRGRVSTAAMLLSLGHPKARPRLCPSTCGRTGDPPGDSRFAGRLGSEAAVQVWQDLLGKQTCCYQAAKSVPAALWPCCQSPSPVPNPRSVCPAHCLNTYPGVLPMDLENVCCRSHPWTHLFPNPPYRLLRNPQSRPGPQCVQTQWSLHPFPLLTLPSLAT